MAVLITRIAPLLLLAAATFLVGWTHPLSQSAFFSVNPHVSYSQVKADPEGFVGTTLMLAGRIEAHRRGARGTELEILCYSRNRDDRPVVRDEECGSFLVRAAVLLDPEEFAAGRLVTLTGVVRGREMRPQDGAEDAYPVFGLGEIQLWPIPREPQPHRRYRHPHWDPFWDPWCDPFHWRYDPWRRCRHRW